MPYPNGQVPLDLLVSRPTGTKDMCWCFPGTARKLDRLTQLGQGRHGVTLRVTGPNDAYRLLSVQRRYWDTMPPGMAAYPGTSTHGGLQEDGTETGAVDIGNWALLSQEDFYALAREAGLVPNVFPWEPWHLVDYDPWGATPTDLPEETTMTTLIQRYGQPITYELSPGVIYAHADAEERRTAEEDLRAPVCLMDDDDFRRRLKRAGFHAIVGDWSDPTWSERLPAPGVCYIEPAGTKR